MYTDWDCEIWGSIWIRLRLCDYCHRSMCDLLFLFVKLDCQFWCTQVEIVMGFESESVCFCEFWLFDCCNKNPLRLPVYYTGHLPSWNNMILENYTTYITSRFLIKKKGKNVKKSNIKYDFWQYYWVCKIFWNKIELENPVLYFKGLQNSI